MLHPTAQNLGFSAKTLLYLNPQHVDVVSLTLFAALCDGFWLFASLAELPCRIEIWKPSS